MAKRKAILRYWILFYFWMAVIFAGSSVPAENMPDIRYSFLSLAVHFLEYFILGLLCIKVLNESYLAPNIESAFAMALIFCFVFALSDELHQYFVPGRMVETKDLILDGTGVLAGLLLYVRKRNISWLK